MKIVHQEYMFFFLFLIKKNSFSIYSKNIFIFMFPRVSSIEHGLYIYIFVSFICKRNLIL
jgi:hypothetical protein